MERIVGIPDLIAVRVDPTVIILAAGFLCACTITDLAQRRVPNLFIAVGLFIGLTSSALHGIETLLGNIVAAVLLASILYSLRLLGTKLFGRPGIGMGDVKLTFVLGVFLGWPSAVVVYLGVCLAAAYGLAGISVGRLSRGSRLPLVPFILVGGFAYAILSA